MTVAVSRPSPPAAPRPPLPLPSLAELFGAAKTQLLWRSRFYWLWLRRGVGLCPPRKFSAAHLAEGLTYVLPGIEAESAWTYGICDGLLAGGLRGAVRVFNWGLPFPGGYLANLCRIDRNRRRGADLAREIVAYQNQYPTCPVNIVAHSGGAGIGVFAAEALPADRPLHSLTLIHGALSPTYDLRRALARTRKGILNSWSPRDHVVSVGTRIFGTTDRQFCFACGSEGFQRPPHVPENDPLYAKLTQIPWSPSMIEECSHTGGHLTSACEEYLTRYITPWINEA